MQDIKYWLWLSLIRNLGNKTKFKLLETFKNPKIIYYLSKKELLNINGIGEKIVNTIMDSKNEDIIKYHLDYMYNNKIEMINIYDNDYPFNLKQIYDPPISLFIKGNKQLLKEKNIAIIGCRDCSEYGKKSAKYFSYNLTKSEFNIVSGLAKGIDSYAHWGCLEAFYENENINILKKSQCGKTIAVVGNGLNEVYPKENVELSRKIIESGGTIISEYPCGTRISKKNFPARNRIVSGISEGIIVVEAKKKSGTLITVDFALEQGRDVYVVPGNINSINSYGTNDLIKQGATIVTSYEDILK